MKGLKVKLPVTAYGRWLRERPWLGFTLAVALVVVAWFGWQASRYLVEYKGQSPVWVYIPRGIQKAEIAQRLREALGAEQGNAVAGLLGNDVQAMVGAYKIMPGDHAYSVARRINQGRQTPVRLTFNNIRTLEQLAQRLSEKLDMKPQEFIRAVNNAARNDTMSVEGVVSQLFPDSYDVYYTDTPRKVIRKIRANSHSFWTRQRRQEAAALGLTPLQVVTLASIVEEETTSKTERPKIARLYINRLDKGMPLQADPTVKFAAGDFAAKRITGDMLDVQSPYNTYKNIGLPPGPIRLPEKATIEAVLNAPQHDYLYMCASPEMDGTHVFSRDFDSHRKIAAAYRAALNKLNIR